MGRHIAAIGLLSALVLVSAYSWPVAVAQVQFQINRFGVLNPAEQETVAGVYLPTDRALSRAVARAKERLQNREYQEALVFIQGILGREEDAFLERLDGDREQLGLKAAARRMIGELPPEGHDTYERLYGARARRQLEAALAAANQMAIANVVRQYFHTYAGYEAALVLAQMESDQGHRLAAAQLYQELIESPRAASRFEPQLSVMAATNQLAARQPEAAAETLRLLFERQQSWDIVLSGVQIPSPAKSADMVAWLSRYIGEPSQKLSDEINWLTPRGNATRNTTKAGGAPHLRARWQARVVNDPSLEAYLVGRSDDHRQRGLVVLPGARPIAAGDVVLMRTLENIVAVDWNTGKRIWETREDDELKIYESSDSRQRIEQQQWLDQSNPVDARMWDDSLVNSLSSDGEMVFVLRGVSVAQDERVMNWQVMPGFGGTRGERTATTNQLAAYDLATQGKLVWEIDGSRATGALDGVFFLGAPLAIDSTLYVLAEVRSAIYLVALNPSTGEVCWQQQLVGLESGIGLDPVRRQAAATPSYDGGILVCPTGASAVVGIDIVKRELAWVYRYPRQLQSPAEARNLWQHAGQAQIVRANDRWLDSTAIISEDRVFLTPPESGELHCLDLRTGKLVWKQRQGDSLFLGAVDSGRLLLIGAEKVQLVRAADGMPAWEQEYLALPAGSLPSGHGYMSDGTYYLPLTTGKIAAINTAEAKLTILSAAQSNVALGNLICYRGSVISQSPLVLEKFEQLEALRLRTEVALANNPDDATALRELAELTRANGDRLKAVKLLKRARELAPSNSSAEDMLAELLLEGLADDYAAFRNDVPLLSQLIHDPEQHIELQRIEARGLEDMGQRLAAWDAYMRLADFTTEQTAYLRPDAQYRVRSDRWIAGRLARLWSESSALKQKQIMERLAARQPAIDEVHTAAELRHYLAHLDQLPGAEPIRLALAKLFLERSRAQEAELELLQLSACNDGDVRTTARDLLGQLALTSTADHTSQVSKTIWPRGPVETALLPATPQSLDRNARIQSERQAGYRLLRIEQDHFPGTDPIQWFVATDCSHLVGRNASGDDLFHLPVEQNEIARQQRDSSLVYAARLGRLIYVFIGGQVIAIDSRSAGNGRLASVLWQTDLLGRYGPDGLRGIRNSTALAFRTSRRPVYHAWSDRKRLAGAIGMGVCSLGPVTPRGVVFQEVHELKCVDPLSGEVLWSRTDLPPGCELFGDDELVFAADMNGRVAHVIRLIDGELLGTRPLSQHEWLLTAGRNLIELGFQVERTGRALIVRVRDVLAEKTVFESAVPVASRLTVVDSTSLAVYEPSGRFQWIDVRTGDPIIDEQLEPMEELQSIETMHSGEELFLFVSTQPNQQHKPVGQFDFPLINGHVYKFSTLTGESLWPTPALVRNRGIVLSQASDVPFLVFADRRMVRDAATGGGSQLRVLCIDKETGETVYRNDQLPDTSAVRFRVRTERHDQPVVALELSAGKIQWTLTDRPRPPRLPSNDDLEAPPEVTEGGLRAIGRKFGETLRSSLQGQAENAAERPAIDLLDNVEDIDDN